ncbi:MAG: hypothetical protein LAT51_12940 [Flavobacteriaceae bacterium]|nr:hypothetical protein [Flavobacteriaceae bacterium]
MTNKKSSKKEKDLSKDELERLELLQQANQKVGKQLSINTSTSNLEEIDELRNIISKDFEDPEQKYNLYYKGIRKLLIDHLPKGKEFKEMRDIIYDEKNIFLNLGKRKSDNNGVRKSDGRMTYQPVMNEMLDIIIRWISESKNPFKLYQLFYALNEKHGYGHEEYDKSTLSVAKAMKKLAEDDL